MGLGILGVVVHVVATSLVLAAPAKGFESRWENAIAAVATSRHLEVEFNVWNVVNEVAEYCPSRAGLLDAAFSAMRYESNRDAAITVVKRAVENGAVLSDQQTAQLVELTKEMNLDQLATSLHICSHSPKSSGPCKALGRSLLTHENDVISIRAATVLLSSSPSEQDGIECLKRFASSEHPRILQCVAAAIHRIQEPSRALLEELDAMIMHKNVGVRVMAAGALVRHRRNVAVARVLLQESLTDRSEYISLGSVVLPSAALPCHQRYALQYLGMCAKSDQSAMNVIDDVIARRMSLGCDFNEVRSAIVSVKGELVFGTKHYEEALLKIANSNDSPLQAIAMEICPKRMRSEIIARLAEIEEFESTKCVSAGTP